MKIKVCGMTKVGQVYQLDEMGVPVCGFIFYPQSPRFVLKYCAAKDIKKIKAGIKKVGVFVNTPADDILRTVDDCGLDWVQLHGNETPGFCNSLSTKLPVIKAFSINEQSDIPAVVQPFEGCASFFLFDAVTEKYGGSGKKFNWKILENHVIDKPFFLSGGIQPDDVEMLKKFEKSPAAKNLFAFDINSRFEISPGVKDIAKINTFYKEMNGGK